ncbi:hypothetical protein [Solitalea koreensis]|uniref:DUF2178 domain-containing protein n=1 Tax=Solitalea koreensis TaxID=543615 RepID=A0A521AKI9_9SPHI|nr:hypothetical protein [Solitalea koreensis]SMO35281.1 hypothetical protein SAMN06265350_101200 [Solitalea koreensis]
MENLLSHRFKKVGTIIAPLGFFLWVCMQKGIVTKVLTFVFGESAGGQNSPYHYANVIIAIISFFSFLGGVYLLSFSKEKQEDEMVQRTRLESFQFAAQIQIIFIIVGFIFFILFGESQKGHEAILMLFFIVMVFLFWLTFIGRFNYVLHVKLKQ